MRCKVGDLTFIAGGFTHNIGKVVTVHKPVSIDIYNIHHDWWVKSDSPLQTDQGMVTECVIPDNILQPIKPLSPEDLDIDKIKELTE